MSNFSFQWNYSHSIILKRKGFGKELNKYFAELMRDYSDEYVPYDTGALASQTRISATNDHGTVTYIAPHAGYQYTGDNGSLVPESEWNRNRSVHPLATSFWDKAAWSQYGSVISRKLNQKRKELSV